MKIIDNIWDRLANSERYNLLGRRLNDHQMEKKYSRGVTFRFIAGWFVVVASAYLMVSNVVFSWAPVTALGNALLITLGVFVIVFSRKRNERVVFSNGKKYWKRRV